MVHVSHITCDATDVIGWECFAPAKSRRRPMATSYESPRIVAGGAVTSLCFVMTQP
jgi:hypothetical protein